jgi:hypothetical protein
MPFRNISTSGSFISRDLSFYEENIDATAEYDDDTDPSNETSIQAFDAGHNIDNNGLNSDDQFGQSIAVGCGRIVVGAPLDDFWDPEFAASRDWNRDVGSAYIHDLNGTLITKISDPDDAAVSGDGVGRQQFDRFGTSVAVGSDRIVVGAPFRDTASVGDTRTTAEGAAYIYDLDGSLISRLKPVSDTTPDFQDNFGTSVAVGSGRIVVGAPGWKGQNFVNYFNNAGAAYIFDLKSNEQICKLTVNFGANVRFGYSVAVGSGRIVVGAPTKDQDSRPLNSGAAFIYDLDGNLISTLTAGADEGADYQFGSSVAVGSGRIVVGQPFDSETTTWGGSVYIYDLDGTLINKITGNEVQYADLFGFSVSVGSGRIVVGSPYSDPIQLNTKSTGAATNWTGRASVHDLDGSFISSIYYSNGTSAAGSNGDRLGFSVAVGSGKIVVGAPNEDVSVITSSAGYYADGTTLQTANPNASIGTNVPDGGAVHIWNTPDVKHHLDILD